MSGWQTTPQPTKPLSALTQSALGHYGSEAAVLAAWQAADAALSKAKELESALRAALFEINFPNPTEGTQRNTLANGWSLKAQVPYRYDLTNKEAKTEKAIDAMTEISQQAGFVADRLITWKPELSIKEYRLLNPDNPAMQSDEQKKILAVLAPILTIKPGSPQLELEPPKA